MTFGSAASMVAGLSWSGTAVAAVRPALEGEAGVLRLRIADFPPLQASFGAVRLAFTALGQVSPMPPFIVAHDASDYFAVSAECTHQSCLIPAFGATKTSTCPCHGSRFGHDGRVIRGPAAAPLARYEASLAEPGVLQVVLPDIPSYAVTVQQILTPGDSRLALGFPSLSNVDYELLGRASADAEWARQSFAITENGPADRTVIKGNGGNQVIYAERSAASGLLAVGAKVRTV